MFVLDDDQRKSMRRWMHEYINEFCIHRVKPGDKPLMPLHPNHAPNGYTWLIMSRRGLTNRTFLNYLGILFWDKFAEKYKKNKFQISGLETACIPMITAINMTSALFDIEDLNCFYIRKKPKDYGLFQQVEGLFDKELPVMVIDDFYNSRSTFLKCKEKLEELDLKIYDKAFSIIDKRMEVYMGENGVPDQVKGWRENIRKSLEGLEVVSLFQITDFDLEYDDYMKMHENREKGIFKIID